MGNKAAADHGAQAAIGDIINSTDITGLIGQLCSTNNVVIQNLHVHFTLERDEPLGNQQEGMK